jgi:xylulokinase
MLSLGYDIGSSFVKGAVIDCETGETLVSAAAPREELTIHAPHPGWAEQDPEMWWRCVVDVTKALAASGRVRLADVRSIGISYQMHGLVVIDGDGKVLRPSIIWCDSRAVEIGKHAYVALGEHTCLSTLLNSPGNFTASKLRWIRENEPECYARIAHVLLPGDYIAHRLTGEATTTVTGLSEGIFWDFALGAPATRLLTHYDIDARILSRVVPAIGLQGTISHTAAEVLGLKEGTPVSYRAGDQPNNAFSLNVLEPGEIAATAGTSGVVYGVTDRTAADPKSRVNLFAHVNHTQKTPRLGVLLCINGTGILYSWLRRFLGGTVSYDELNALAASASVGADGVSVLPFGNGAERMLENRIAGAHVAGLDLVRHSRAHIVRAAQEGIAFAFRYGMDIMNTMGMSLEVIRAGRANMFLSPIFRETLANITGAHIELYDTDGAVGAARGAALGAGVFTTARAAFASLRKIEEVDPLPSAVGATTEAYDRWKQSLDRVLSDKSRTK